MAEKIVIIGAGPAGLTAGYKLLQKSPSLDVTILEESSTLGGISRTVNYNGNRMDIGGHRFFSKDQEVLAMWDELMPPQGKGAYDDLVTGRKLELTPGGADPEKTDLVMLKRRRVSRIFYRKKFFDYPVKMNFNTICSMGLFATFLAGMSYLFSLFRKLPETSLENFYINRFGRKLYSMFFEGYTEKLWGRHPRVISPEWGAQRVKGLSIATVLKDIFFKLLPRRFRKGKVETSLIEEFSYPKYGPGQLWERTAEKFCSMGGKLEMNWKAVSFQRDENGSVISVTGERDGEKREFPCDTVISSMPVKDLIAAMPGAPERVRAIAHGLPYRDFVTVGLLVKKMALKNRTGIKTINHIIPDCWIYVQDPGVKLGRIQIFNNWSPYLVADKDTIFLGLEYFCREKDDFWNMSKGALVEFATGELVKMGVLEKEEPILASHVEWVPKAYPAYFDTYKDMGEVVSFCDSIENLYCVGRNGQHRYNNMDHSMATSFEAVKHILAGGKGSKSSIWAVNTEKEYHEEKSNE